MHICVSAKETWWTANPSYLLLNLTLSDLLVGVMELIPLATRSVPFLFIESDYDMNTYQYISASYFPY